MSQRLKGQETAFAVVGPDGEEQGLGDVVSAEFVFRFDILTQGLLGETSDRKDDIFKGTRGRMQVQIEAQEAFRFIERAKDRSQRRRPASDQFNITSTLALADGSRVRAAFDNIFFSDMPVQVGGRDEFVTLDIEWEAEDGRFLYS
jgi:hypothetical protein